MSLSVSLLDDGVLELFAGCQRSCWEVTEILAGPRELGPKGFVTPDYVERVCAMQKKAWGAICRLERAGVIRLVERSAAEMFDPRRWVAT